MAKVEVFNKHLDKYEQWFVDNKAVFLSEVNAIKELLPTTGKIVEVGVGSGLFAEKLGISEGCDPSLKMREMAEKRGIHVIDGVAEDLPYENESIDCVLMVTTICFVDDAEKTFREVNRVLKNKGSIIMAFVDKSSKLGKIYQAEKEESLFYKDAVFYSADDIYKFLWDNNFEIEKTAQTIFGKLKEIKDIQKAIEGNSKGSFVVVKANKI